MKIANLSSRLFALPGGTTESFNLPTAAVKNPHILRSGVFWDPNDIYNLVTGREKAGISLTVDNQSKECTFPIEHGVGEDYLKHCHSHDQYISPGSQKTPESSRKVNLWGFFLLRIGPLVVDTIFSVIT